MTSFFKQGQAYFIRAVTFHAIGRVVDVNDQEILLEDASYVSDDGDRYGRTIRNSKFHDNAEVEYTGKQMIVGRPCIVDAQPWDGPLPNLSDACCRE